MAKGTLTLADLQATQNASTIYEIGMDTTWEGISNTLAAHNGIVRELYGELVERTTMEAVRYGGSDTMTMEDGDELSMPRAQKVTAGSNVGFPLNKVEAGLQWSEMWFRKHTVEELAAQVNAMMDADVNRQLRDIRRSFYLSTNYTHTDHLVRNIDIPVKRLVNADSAPLPPAPDGSTFTASSHTHYTARVSTLAASDLDALVLNVREHFNRGQLAIAVHLNDAATISNTTTFPKFVPDVNVNIVQPSTATYTNRGLDIANIYDRRLGLYDGVEVWVKPWAIANYWFCWNMNQPKPLVWRYDPDYGDNLDLVYDNPDYPLLAKAFRRIFGIGVKQRVNGAILYIGGTTTYVDPTIN